MDEKASHEIKKQIQHHNADHKGTNKYTKKYTKEMMKKQKGRNHPKPLVKYNKMHNKMHHKTMIKHNNLQTDKGKQQLADLHDSKKKEDSKSNIDNMKGGMAPINSPHEKFEVTTLENLDFDKIKLSKKIKINWMGVPEGPPTDCTIL